MPPDFSRKSSDCTLSVRRSSGFLLACVCVLCVLLIVRVCVIVSN